MDFKRTRKELGGGSGSTQYESKRFRVVHWNLQRGKQTKVELEIEDHWIIEVKLEGHVNLSSDKECLAVFTPTEILKTFDMIEKKGFEEGKEYARRHFSGIFSGRIDF
jgi:hypothetical protein